MINLDLSALGKTFFEELDQRKAFFRNKISELKKRAENPEDWLGWLRLEKDPAIFQEIDQFAKNIIASKKFENLVIAGIGGSALGSQAIMEALLSPVWNQLSPTQRKNYLKYYFVDNVDPDWNQQILGYLDLEKTLFCVISKSGSTAETASTFLWAFENLRTLKPDSWQENFVLITDSKAGALREFSNQYKVKAFSVPSNVGGRFSVFSSVGLVPLALTGIKITDFQSSLQRVSKKYLEPELFDLKENKAVCLALAIYLAYLREDKKINPLMIYSSCLSRIGDWYIQLLAESIGKSKKIGITPLKFVGATDQHSQLQLISDGPHDKFPIFIFVNKFKNQLQLSSEKIKGFEKLAGESFYRLIQAEGKATRQALLKKQIPSIALTLEKISESSLAELIFTFELMTALLGELFEVNAFNQPGVELAKKYTYALLGKKDYQSYLEDLF